MKRSERDEIVKKAAKKKRLLKQLLVAVFSSILLISFLSLPSNSIDLVKHDHACSHTECEYTVVVKNTDHFGHSGYIRINAFIEISRGDTVSREIVASERVEFNIVAGEEKVIDGKFSVVTKPRIVNFSAGQINENI